VPRDRVRLPRRRADPRSLQALIIAYLADRRGATLRQIVQALGDDYWVLWDALSRLRDAGLVHPPIREGAIGRPSGSPIRYRLSYTQRRRLHKGAVSKGA